MALILGINRSARTRGCRRRLLWLLIWSTAGIVGHARSGQSAKHDSGWYYFHEEAPEVPWSIHILKIERAHRDLQFCTALGNGSTLGMNTVSEQVKRFPLELGQPVAAVNGDFYKKHENYPGDPRDLQIHQGELVSSPTGHACFWIDAAGNPHVTNVVSRFRVIWADGTTTPFGLNEERPSDGAVLYTSALGASTCTSGGLELVLESAPGNRWPPLRVGQIHRARVREVRTSGNTALSADLPVLSLGSGLGSRLPKVEPETVLSIATETIPDLTGVSMAIGGGPTLVRDGRAMQWRGLQMRHPRTAIGWNTDSIFMVEVDGRQSHLSVGMTLPELAAYMIKLGCANAMNLDGGGSATLWVCGNVMNSPSEGQERPGANALVLVQKKGDAKGSSDSRRLLIRTNPFAPGRAVAEH